MRQKQCLGEEISSHHSPLSKDTTRYIWTVEIKVIPEVDNGLPANEGNQGLNHW